MNLEGEEALHDPDLGAPRVEIVHAGLRTADGGQRASVDREEALEISAELRVLRVLRDPSLSFEVRTRSGRTLLAIPAIPILEGDDPVLKPGDDPVLTLEVENRLRPGRYVAKLAVTRAVRKVDNLAASRTFEFPFVVSGDPVAGSRIALKHDLRVAASAPATLAQQLDRALESARPRAGV